MLKYGIAVLGIILAGAPAWAASYYAVRLDDPKAVYLTRGDGAADDTAAIQQAIDKVQETTNQGIVFVPEGRYRITSTINVWPGIRVIGYGPNRPVFVLGENTPGYQDPNAEKYMVFFAGGRPRAGRGGPAAPGGRGGNGQPQDAGAGTFYSAISNIDLEIRDGNPGAVGVRARYAQHCFMAHMDFRIGAGLAGIHEAGNVGEDLHFFGGQYAIWTRRPSPGWQYTVVDASFEGQREAAIREREAGLTLIRPRFRNVPTAISIDAGAPDEVWVKNGRMEDITGPAVIVSLENNARTEINLENVVCQRVPVFASFRESGKKVAAPAGIYEVKVFSHGLHYSDIGVVQAVRKYLHLVDARWGCHLLSALAEGGEDGHALADDVLEVDLGPRIIFQADDDGWAGNVFHPAILHPDLVGGAGFDGDCRRNVTEPRADEREAGFALADGRFTLPLEGGVHHGVLPPRRWPAGPDGVLAAEKMKVLTHVAGFVNAREAGADAEVHVGHEAVLGVAGTHADGALIAVPDLEIDVADSGVEGAGAGIRGLSLGSAAAGASRARLAAWSTSAAGWSPAAANPASGAGPATREEDHIPFTVLVLVPGSAFRQQEDRAGGPVPDQANAGPDVDGLRQAVDSLGNEDDSLARGFLNLVNGPLKRLGIVGETVAADGEGVRAEVDGLGVVQAEGVVGRPLR